MSLVLMRDGRSLFLNAFLRLASPTSKVVIRLYKSDITPHAADLPIQYLLTEADFTGYTRQPVAVWNPPDDIGNVATCLATPVIFTAATPILMGNTIYGYFASPLEDLDKVLWAERFIPAAYRMDTDGQTLILELSLSQQSLTT